MTAVAALHPVSLSDIPGEGLDQARAHYATETARLQQLHPAHLDLDQVCSHPARTSARFPPLALAASLLHTLVLDQVLRLILAVQCNAFYSGFYVLCSMFNHACNPSCIKLARPDGSSEVRALRAIPAGQECTISYLSPPLQSFARRVALLKS